MSLRIRPLFFTLLAALAGCGGGGSSSGTGGTGPSPSPGNDWLQFTPATIELTGYEGRTLDFSITAKSSKTIAQAFNVGIIDPNGIVKPQVQISATSPYEYRVGMTVSDKLAAGPHSGKLEVRLCEDDPLTCAKPIPGSPWYVPITVTVKAATNLTTLTPQPGLGRWTSVNGSANIGYVPLRLDPAKFSQRWVSSYLPESVQMTATMPVLQDGVAYIVIIKDGYRNNFLRAIDEASGKPLWETKIPNSQCHVTAAALAAGKVFVGAGTCAFMADTLQAYDQKTGQLLYSVPRGDVAGISAPWANSDALFIQGRSDIGSGNYLTRIAPATGDILWRTGVNDLLSSGFDTQSLYLLNKVNLSVVNPSSGTPAAQASPATACYSALPLVPGAPGQFYLSCNRNPDSPQLIAYDSAAQKTLWTASITAPATMAVAGSTLYSVNGSQLEARSAADGKVLWSMNPQTGSTLALGPLASLLVTDNLLFVSGDLGVAAIDLASQKVVWTFPQGGPMAISATGVLYLPGHVGTYIRDTVPALVAVNLL